MNKKLGRLQETEIRLSKPCSGAVLHAAIRKAVQEIGGHVDEKVLQYYAPAGTSHVQPLKVTMLGSLGTFLRYEFMTEILEMQRTDLERLKMFIEAGFSKSKVDKFASVLNKHIK